jgi:hypothetical protein
MDYGVYSMWSMEQMGNVTKGMPSAFSNLLGIPWNAAVMSLH